MPDNGFIFLHRRIKDWGWYTDDDVKSVFLHLLLSASHCDTNWQGVELKAGQLVTGRKSLSILLRKSERRIRTALTKLKTTNEVTIRSTNKYSVVTINNWKGYQSVDQQTVQRATNKRPTRDQQETTINKIDNINKKDKGDRKEIVKESPELIEIRHHYESTFKRKSRSSVAWADNAAYWLTIYTLDEVKQAITIWANYGWVWKGRDGEEPTMSLEILFRTRNKAGKCNYIEALLERGKETVL